MCSFNIFRWTAHKQERGLTLDEIVKYWGAIWRQSTVLRNKRFYSVMFVTHFELSQLDTDVIGLVD